MLVASVAASWGCSSAVDSKIVAVGYSDEIVSSGPCTLEPSGAEPMKIETWSDGTVHGEAKRPGSVRVACPDGIHAFDIREPTSVVLEVPPSLPTGARVRVTIRAKAADGTDLEIGRYADVAWTASGAVTADSHGCEFPPWCDSGFFIRAGRGDGSDPEAAGTLGVVEAAFQNRRANEEVKVEQNDELGLGAVPARRAVGGTSGDE